MEIAIFIAGMSAGLALHRILSENVYQHPWLICKKCKYKKDAEKKIAASGRKQL